MGRIYIVDINRRVGYNFISLKAAIDYISDTNFPARQEENITIQIRPGEYNELPGDMTESYIALEDTSLNGLTIEGLGNSSGEVVINTNHHVNNSLVEINDPAGPDHYGGIKRSAFIFSSLDNFTLKNFRINQIATGRARSAQFRLSNIIVIASHRTLPITDFLLEDLHIEYNPDYTTNTYGGYGFCAIYLGMLGGTSAEFTSYTTGGTIRGCTVKTNGNYHLGTIQSHGYKSFYGGTTLGNRNILIEDCYLSCLSPAGDFTAAYGLLLSYAQDITLRNNKFLSIYGVWYEYNNNILIENNIFAKSGSSQIYLQDEGANWAGGYMYIRNNTFVDLSYSAIYANATITTDNIVENNIFAYCSQSATNSGHVALYRNTTSGSKLNLYHNVFYKNGNASVGFDYNIYRNTGSPNYKFPHTIYFTLDANKPNHFSEVPYIPVFENFSDFNYQYYLSNTQIMSDSNNQIDYENERDYPGGGRNYGAYANTFQAVISVNTYAIIIQPSHSDSNYELFASGFTSITTEVSTTFYNYHANLAVKNKYTDDVVVWSNLPYLYQSNKDVSSVIVTSSSNQGYVFVNSTATTFFSELPATVRFSNLSDIINPTVYHNDLTYDNIVYKNGQIINGDLISNVFFDTSSNTITFEVASFDSYTVEDGPGELTLFDISRGTDEYTKLNIVSVDITTQGGVYASAYLMSESQTTQPISTDGDFFTTIPETFALTSGLGEKFVYLWAKDDIGQVTLSPDIHKITLVSPIVTINSFALLDRVTGDLSNTLERIISVDLDYSGPAAEYLLTEDYFVFPDITDPFIRSSFVTILPDTYTLQDVTNNDIKIVYFYIIDQTGEQGANTSHAITLAIPQPELKIFDRISGSSYSTNDRIVSVEVSDYNMKYWLVSDTITTYAAASSYDDEPYPESSHNHLLNSDLSWTFVAQKGTPSSMEVTFNSLSTTGNFLSKLYIFDKDGVQVSGSPFFGSLANFSFTISGHIMHLRYITGSNNAYGFKIESISYTEEGQLWRFNTTPPSTLLMETLSRGSNNIYLWTADEAETILQPATISTIIFNTASPKLLLFDRENTSSNYTDERIICVEISNDDPTIVKWFLSEYQDTSPSLSDQLLDVNESSYENDDYPETPHPMGRQYPTRYYYYAMPHTYPTQLRVTFSKLTGVRPVYEYIKVYDKDENLIGSYFATQLSGVTLTVPGDTIIIEVKSDVSSGYYGFSIDKIAYERFYTTSPATFIIDTPNNGNKHLYLWEVDQYGYVFSESITNNIQLNFETPIMSIKDRVTGDILFVKDRLVSIEICQDDHVACWLLTESNLSSPPDADDSGFTFNKPETFLITTNNNGSKKIYCWVKDAFDYVFEQVGSYMITLAIEQPNFEVRDRTSGSLVNTDERIVSIEITNDLIMPCWYLTEEFLDPLQSLPESPHDLPDLAQSEDWEYIYVVKGQPSSFIIDFDALTDLYHLSYFRLFIFDGDGNNYSDVAGYIGDSFAGTITSKHYYTALTLAGETFTIQGDTVRIVLSLNGSFFDAGHWGFKIDIYEDVDNATFLTSRPISYIIKDRLNRSQTIKLWTKDSYGFILETPTTQEIELNLELPSLNIYDRTSNSTEISNDWTISTEIIGGPKITGWLLTDQYTEREPDDNGVRWELSLPISHTMEVETEDNREVYLWVKDASNIAHGTSISNSITFDIYPPVPTLLNLIDRFSCDINNSTNSRLISVDLAWQGTSYRYALSESETFFNSPFINLETFAQTNRTLATTYLLSDGDEIKSVYFRLQGVEDVISIVITSFINLDVPPITDPELILRDRTSGSLIFTNDKIVSVEISNDLIADAWLISETQSTIPSYLHSGFDDEPDTYTFSADNGLKTLYLWIRDKKNNINQNIVSFQITQQGPYATALILSDRDTARVDYTDSIIVSVDLSGKYFNKYRLWSNEYFVNSLAPNQPYDSKEIVKWTVRAQNNLIVNPKYAVSVPDNNGDFHVVYWERYNADFYRQRFSFLGFDQDSGGIKYAESSHAAFEHYHYMSYFLDADFTLDDNYFIIINARGLSSRHYIYMYAKTLGAGVYTHFDADGAFFNQSANFYNPILVSHQTRYLQTISFRFTQDNFLTNYGIRFAISEINDIDIIWPNNNGSTDTPFIRNHDTYLMYDMAACKRIPASDLYYNILVVARSNEDASILNIHRLRRWYDASTAVDGRIEPSYATLGNQYLESTDAYLQISNVHIPSGQLTGYEQDNSSVRSCPKIVIISTNNDQEVDKFILAFNTSSTEIEVRYYQYESSSPTLLQTFSNICNGVVGNAEFFDIELMQDEIIRVVISDPVNQKVYSKLVAENITETDLVVIKDFGSSAVWEHHIPHIKSNLVSNNYGIAIRVRDPNQILDTYEYYSNYVFIHGISDSYVSFDSYVTPITHEILSTHGSQTTYLQLCNADGATSNIISDSIYYTEGANVSFELRDIASGVRGQTGQPVVNVVLNATADAEEFILSETQITMPSTLDTWYSAPTTYGFDDPNTFELKTVVLWAKNIFDVVTFGGTELITYGEGPTTPNLILYDRTVGNSYLTNEKIISIDLYTYDATDWFLANGAINDLTPSSTHWHQTPIATWQLTSGDEIKTVWAYVKNTFEIISANTATIELDSIAPAGGALTLYDRVSGKSYITNENIVSVELNIPSDAVAWILSDNSLAGVTESDTRWTSFNYQTWTLPLTSEVQTVEIVFKDNIDNISTPYKSDIILDTVLPQTPDITLSDRTSGSPYLTDSRIISLEAQSADAVKWIASNVILSSLEEHDSEWLDSLPITWLITKGTEEKTVWVYVQDDAGNINSNTGTIFSIAYTPPIVRPGYIASDRFGQPLTASSVGFKITNPGQGSLDWLTDFPDNFGDEEDYSLTYIPGHSSLIGNSSLFHVMSLDADLKSDPVTFTLFDTSDLFDPMVYNLGFPSGYIIRYQNGQIVTPGGVLKSISINSGVITAQVDALSIVYITGNGPGQLSLFDRTTGSTQRTNERIISIDVTTSISPASAVLLSQTQDTQPLYTNSNFVTTLPETFLLDSLVSEIKTVYLWSRDVNNNVSVIPDIYNITMVTSTEAPELTLKDRIGGKLFYSNESTVSIELCVHDAESWIVTNFSIPGIDDTHPDWTSQQYITWTLVAGEGAREVWAYVQDDAGNVNFTSEIITVDIPPISPPTFAINDRTSGSLTFTNDRVISVDIGESIACAWLISETITLPPLSSNLEFLENIPTTHVLSLPNEVKTVYLWTRDSRNNVSQQIVTQSINKQEVVIEAFSIFDRLTGNELYTNDPIISVEISGDTGAFDSYRLSNDSNFLVYPDFTLDMITTMAITIVSPSRYPNTNPSLKQNHIVSLSDGSYAHIAFFHEKDINFDYLYLRKYNITTGAFIDEVEVFANVPKDASSDHQSIDIDKTGTDIIISITCEDSNTDRRLYVFNVDNSNPASSYGSVSAHNLFTDSNQKQHGKILAHDNKTTVTAASYISTLSTARIFYSDSSSTLSMNGTNINVNTLFPMIDIAGVKSIDNDQNGFYNVVIVGRDAATSDKINIWAARRYTGGTGINNLSVVKLLDSSYTPTSDLGNIDYHFIANPKVSAILNSSEDEIVTLVIVYNTSATQISATFYDFRDDGSQTGVFDEKQTISDIGSVGNAELFDVEITSDGYVYVTLIDYVNHKVYSVAFNRTETGQLQKIGVLNTDSNVDAQSISIHEKSNKFALAYLQYNTSNNVHSSYDILFGQHIPEFSESFITFSVPITHRLEDIYNVEQTVYAQVRDAEGVISVSENDNITLTLGALAEFTLQDRMTGNFFNVSDSVVSINISNTGDASLYIVSETQTTTPSLGDAWISIPQTYGFDNDTSEQKTVYLWTRNIFDDIASGGTYSITLGEAIGQPVLTLYDRTSNNVFITNERIISVNICSIEASEYILSNVEILGLTSGDSGWQTTNYSTWELTANSEIKTVWVYVQNDFGSIAGSTSTIELDQILDTPSLTLYDRTNGKSYITNNVIVSIDINKPGAEQWILSNSVLTVEPNDPAWNTTNYTTWELSAGDEVKTIYIYVQDNAENIVSSSGTIELDTAIGQPTVIMSERSSGNVTQTLDNIVSINIGSSEAIKWIVSNSSLTVEEFSPEWQLASPVTWLLPGSSGDKVVWAYIQDASGNINSNTGCIEFISYIQPATANGHAATDRFGNALDEFSIGFKISRDGHGSINWITDFGFGFGNDADYSTVIITVEPTKSDVIVPNSGDVVNLATQPATITLDSIDLFDPIIIHDGVIVYRDGQILDANLIRSVNYSPNVFTFEVSYFDSYSVLNGPGQLILKDTSSGSLDYSNERIVSVDITTAISFPDAVLLSETQTLQPLSSDPNFVTTIPETYRFITGVNELKLVHMWTRDISNNVSLIPSTYDIEYDSFILQPDIVLTDRTSGDINYTSERTISIDLCTNDASQWIVANSVISDINEFNPNWANTEYVTWLLSAGADGPRAVWVYVKDLAGNIDFNVVTINLDTEIINPIIQLLDRTSNSSDYTDNTVVSIDLCTYDNIAWIISNTEIPGITENNPNWGITTYVTWLLTSGDGLKIVWAYVKDLAGNVGSATDTIILDTILSTPTIDLFDRTSNSSDYTNDIVISIDICTFEANYWTVSNSALNIGEFDPSWNTTVLTTWLLNLGSDGDRPVWIYSKDLAGNIRSNVNTILLDTILITPDLELQDRTSGSTENTNEQIVSISLCTYDAISWLVSNVEENDLGEFDSRWNITNYSTWELSIGNGQKTVWAYSKDIAGNIRSIIASIDLLAGIATPILNLFDRTSGNQLATNERIISIELSKHNATSWILENSEIVGIDEFHPSWTTTNYSTWELTANDGDKTVWAYIKDDFGNIGQTSEDIELNLSIAIPTLVLKDTTSDSVSFTNNRVISLDLCKHDATEWIISNTNLGVVTEFDTKWQSTEYTTWLLLAGADGNRVVWAYVKDNAGNIDFASDNIFLDTFLANPELILSDRTFGNTNYTNEVIISVDLSKGGASHCILSNSVINNISEHNPLWGTTSYSTWELLVGSGSKNVWLYVKDVAGNINSTIDTIFLDVELAKPILTLRDVTSASIEYTNDKIVSIDLSRHDAIDWILSNSVINNINENNPNWTNTEYSTWSLSVGLDGDRTVWTYIKDVAGNIEFAIQTIFLDSEITVPDLTLTDRATGSIVYTNNLIVSVDICTYDASQWIVSNISLGSIGEFDSKWANTSYVTWTLLGGPDGSREVWLYSKDVAGNMAVTSDLINLDRFINIPDISLQDRTSGSTEYSNDRVVSVEICTYDASYWIVSNNAIVGIDEFNPNWNMTALTTWLLEDNTGTKNVWIYNKDLAGNIESNIDTIFLDLEINIPIIILSDLTSGNLEYTNNTIVSIDLSVHDATEWIVSNQDLGSVNEFDTQWNTTEYVTWGLLSGSDGQRVVWAYIKDISGNINSSLQTIILDTIIDQPDIALFDRTSGNAEYTNEQIVSITLSFKDAQNWIVSNTEIVGISEITPGWNTTLYSTWTLASGEGPKTVWAYNKDVAGNINFSTDSITLDITLTNPELQLSDLTSASIDYTNNKAISLELCKHDATEWIVSNSVISGLDENNPNWSNTEYVTWLLPGSDGSKVVWAYIKDVAGNIKSTINTITLKLEFNIPELKLTDLTSGNVDYTNEQIVSLNLCKHDATEWIISNTNLGVVTEFDINWAGTEYVTWLLTPSDGQKIVWAYIKDIAGNINSAIQTIILDTTINIPELDLFDRSNGSQNYTNEFMVSIETCNFDAAEWIISNSSIASIDENNINWNQTVYSTWELLAGADGQRVVWLYNKDVAGNISSIIQTIILDTTLANPAIDLFDISSGSQDYTNNQIVSIDLCTYDASQWIVSNSDLGSIEETDPLWSATEYTTWSLDNINGQRFVWAYSKDVAGNIRSAITSIILDLGINNPELTLTDRETGSSQFTNEQIVSLELCRHDATNWVISNSALNLTEFSTLWSSTELITWLLEPSDGLKVVWAYIKDLAGNIASTIQTIILDTIITTPVLNIYDRTSGSSQYTNERIISVDLCVFDANEWILANNAIIPITITNSNWATTGYTTWLLSDVSGQKTVWAYSKDIAGNIAQTSQNITLDIILDIPIATLQDRTSGNTDYTNDQIISLNILANESVEYVVSNIDLVLDENSPLWQLSYPNTWDITTSDGPKGVWVYVKDIAGNIESILSTIILDTQIDVPVLSIFDRISNNTLLTGDPVVSVELCKHDATEWILSNVEIPGITEINTFWTSTEYVTWLLTLQNNENKTVWAYIKDAAGNISSGTNSIFYLSSVIAAPIVDVFDRTTGDSQHTNEQIISIEVSHPEYPVIVNQWLIAEDEISQPSFLDVRWTTTPIETIKVSSTDGVKTIYAWVQNIANAVGSIPGTASIIFDTIGPIGGSLTLYDRSANNSDYTNDTIVSLEITGEIGSPVAWYVVTTTATMSVPSAPVASNPGFILVKPTTVALLDIDTSHIVYVWSKDSVDNVSSLPLSNSIILDRVAPIIGDFKLADRTSGSIYFTDRQTVSVLIADLSFDVAYWLVSENALAPDEFDSRFVSVKPELFELSPSNGLKTTYLWEKDFAGNISNCAVATMLLNVTKASVVFATYDPYTRRITLKFDKDISGLNPEDIKIKF